MFIQPIIFIDLKTVEWVLIAIGHHIGCIYQKYESHGKKDAHMPATYHVVRCV